MFNAAPPASPSPGGPHSLVHLLGPPPPGPLSLRERGNCIRPSPSVSPHPLAAWSWRATLLRSLLGPHPLAPSPFGRGGTRGGLSRAARRIASRRSRVTSPFRTRATR